MMYVHDDQLKQEEDLNNFNTFTSPSDKNFSKLLWTKDPDHKYKLKHGLSAATRNIRARRFKTKMKYNKDEILEVAKKLKNMIIKQNDKVHQDNNGFGLMAYSMGSRRTEGYIKRDLISNNEDAIDKYKLFFTTSYSTNAVNPPDVIVGNPGDVCTAREWRPAGGKGIGYDQRDSGEHCQDFG